MHNKVIIVDGNSLLFRAYYATAYPGANIMRTKEGLATNAIFAFSNMILKIVDKLKDEDKIFVAFDTGKKTFRHQELETYKANRKPAPEDLIVQFPIARELLKSLGIYTFEEEGYEGDDLAGSVAIKAAKAGYQTIIYTSDRDFLQLVDDKIEVDLLIKGMSDIRIMHVDDVIETYGFVPAHIIDFKGLRGDSSDNLPGIPSIGEKTAQKLIQTYGTLEDIIKAAEAGEIKGKVGEMISLHKEDGKLCKKLAIIKTDLDLPFSLEDLTYDGYLFEKASDFANKYELKTFLTKLPKKWQHSQSEKLNYEEIDDTSNITLSDHISFVLASDYTNYHKDDVFGLAFTSENKNYYISVDNLKKDEKLKAYLKDEKILKSFYDYKATKCALNRYGIEVNGNGFDLMLASYLLDSSSRGDLDSVYASKGISLDVEEDEMNIFKALNVQRYIKASFHLHRLMPQILVDLAKLNLKTLFYDVELPLSDILARMEIEGIEVNAKTLDELSSIFKAKLEEDEKIIFEIAGHSFNISSPKQVAEVLFEELEIAKGNKNSSTSSDVLLNFATEHEIVRRILDYRKYAKLISAYTDGLKNHIFPDHKIHCIFNQAVTATGRLSSSDPNLQNIAVRDEDGKLIRKAFYYEDEDLYLLSLDYSQIELRVLAHFTHSKALIDIFKNDEDIHEATAKRIFHKDEITDLERRKAKAVNFGIVYGISEWGLCEQLGISRKEASDIISSFYLAFPEIRTYLTKVVEQANELGYVETILGRRRYIREIHDSNYQRREFAKRAAMNAPIQGSAADLIKVAMIKVDELLKKGHYKTRLVLQIHDELLFKIPKDEIDTLPKLIKEEMEHALQLDVPLKTSLGIAKSWDEVK